MKKLGCDTREKRYRTPNHDVDSGGSDCFVFEMTFIAFSPPEVICVDSSSVVEHAAHLCLAAGVAVSAVQHASSIGITFANSSHSVYIS